MADKLLLAGTSQADSNRVQITSDTQLEPLDFAALMDKYRSDELSLSHLGEAAFDRNENAWVIKLLERARLVSSSGVGQNSYPYLAVAYLLERKDRELFKKTLQDMLDEMRKPYGYLTGGIPMGFTLRTLTKVRELVDPESRQYINSVMDEIESLKPEADRKDRELFNRRPQ